MLDLHCHILPCVDHGSAPQSSGEQLLRAYAEVVLATDAHNRQRCSGLSAGYAWVQEQLGRQRAEELRVRADHVLARLVAWFARDDECLPLGR